MVHNTIDFSQKMDYGTKYGKIAMSEAIVKNEGSSM